MFTAYGFHIDFQFRGQKSLPRDLWMAQTPKCTFSEPVSSRMQFLDFFFFSTIFYVYWHMLGCVELKKLQVGAYGDSLMFRWFDFNFSLLKLKIQQTFVVVPWFES